MKKQILTAIAVLVCLCGYAQTKGTSALGFGINSNSSKVDYKDASASDRKYKNNSFGLGYGFFVKDNAKVGIDLNYGTQEISYEAGISATKSKIYGVGVNYQYYYPLVKTLYAYAGGRLAYNYSKGDEKNGTYDNLKTHSNSYTAGAYGGLTWFVSKRLALETSLLSATANYSKYKRSGGTGNGVSAVESSDTNFNLSTSGIINDLGFKIYFLF